MSKTGQNHKNTFGRVCRALFFCLAMIGLAPAVSYSALAAGSVFWFDQSSGFAIGGYDPVAYFVENTPRPGISGLEYEWGGVTWRFANEGNRAAFIADPEVYSPQFGGFDPVAVGRGNPTEGNPENWVIHEGRLLMFYSRALRTIWELDREGTMSGARDRWQGIVSNRVAN